jgi:hypothetical protein
MDGREGSIGCKERGTWSCLFPPSAVKMLVAVFPLLACLHVLLGPRNYVHKAQRQRFLHLPFHTNNVSSAIFITDYTSSESFFPFLHSPYYPTLTPLSRVMKNWRRSIRPDSPYILWNAHKSLSCSLVIHFNIILPLMLMKRNSVAWVRERTIPDRAKAVCRRR